MKFSLEFKRVSSGNDPDPDPTAISSNQPQQPPPPPPANDSSEEVDTPLGVPSPVVGTLVGVPQDDTVYIVRVT